MEYRHPGDLHKHRNAASAMHLTDIVSSGFAQDFSHFAAEVDETIEALKQQINKLEARLRQEGCMDDDGIQRKENEQWMKEDCISCSCKLITEIGAGRNAKGEFRFRYGSHCLGSSMNYCNLRPDPDLYDSSRSLIQLSRPQGKSSSTEANGVTLVYVRRNCRR
ncbi:Peroxidasin-like protein [Chelonia mydas]|uniref:Peroxidasin-like protein n=1 Tax=Chelonia mydas TaxID=8469 RepID=M7BLU2_CHEMY|nr:Peroxidasin-like protein [Chelonia mydas]